MLWAVAVLCWVLCWPCGSSVYAGHAAVVMVRTVVFLDAPLGMEDWQLYCIHSSLLCCIVYTLLFCVMSTSTVHATARVSSLVWSLHVTDYARDSFVEIPGMRARHVQPRGSCALRVDLL